MKPLLIIITVIALTSCFHTKKAITELSKKVDSVGFFRSDTSNLIKKDSTTTSLDLKSVVIEIDYDSNPHAHIPILDDYAPSPAVIKLREVVKALSNDGAPKKIRIEIGDAIYEHSHITSVDSSTGHDTSGFHVTTDNHSYVKTVDRKGTGIGGSFLMIGVIILAILIVAAIIYFKFIKKIPFI